MQRCLSKWEEEIGNRKEEIGKRRWEGGDGKEEMGRRRWEGGDGKEEMGSGLEEIDMGEDVSMRVLYQIWFIRCVIAEAINH